MPNSDHHNYLSISLISIPFRYITIIICRYFPTYLYPCQNSYSSVAHRLFTQKYWAICFLWYNIITPICPTLIIHNWFLFSYSLTQFHYSYSTPILYLFAALLDTILSTLICFSLICPAYFSPLSFTSLQSALLIFFVYSPPNIIDTSPLLSNIYF